MSDFVRVGEFLANGFISLWSAIGTWGIIGVGIISVAILKRVSNLVKKIFEF